MLGWYVNTKFNKIPAGSDNTKTTPIKQYSKYVRKLVEEQNNQQPGREYNRHLFDRHILVLREMDQNWKKKKHKPTVLHYCPPTVCHAACGMLPPPPPSHPPPCFSSHVLQTHVRADVWACGTTRCWRSVKNKPKMCGLRLPWRCVRERRGRVEGSELREGAKIQLTLLTAA